MKKEKEITENLVMQRRDKVNASKDAFRHDIAI